MEASQHHNKQMARLPHQDQQLELCLKCDDQPEWPLDDLGRWALEGFQLAKPSRKATVFRILKTKRSLQAMCPDYRRLK